VTSRLIGFTAFALLARRLDPNEYGAVEFAVALALFFAMVVDFGLETIGARSISRNRNEVARLAAHGRYDKLLAAVWPLRSVHDRHVDDRRQRALGRCSPGR